MVRKILFHSENYESKTLNLGLLIFRIGFGLIMAFAHGLGKVPPAEGFIGYLTSLGLPFAAGAAWAAALSELIGGLFIAIGLGTRLSSAALGFTMFVAAFVAHNADPFEKKEKAILYLLCSLLIFMVGPGKYSIDGIIKKD